MKALISILLLSMSLSAQALTCHEKAKIVLFSFNEIDIIGLDKTFEKNKKSYGEEYVKTFEALSFFQMYAKMNDYSYSVLTNEKESFLLTKNACLKAKELDKTEMEIMEMVTQGEISRLD